MMPGQETRLHRTIGARLFAGWTFQPLLTIAVALNLVLVVLVSTFAGASAFVELLPALPFYVIWLFGVTATARADADGVTWRYFAPRRFTWQQIDGIEFGGVLRAGLGTSGAPAILVMVGGHRHAIGPAFGVRRAYLRDFAEGVRSLAAGARVPTEVHQSNAFWNELLGR